MKSPYDAWTEDVLARDYRRRTRTMKKEFNTIDLFCGAGGAETGMALAIRDAGLERHGLAINHWQVAVETMKENHKDTKTLNMDISAVVPSDVLQPNTRVDIMWASPSCTHHSRAKGGKPLDNQLRAQPDLIFSWLDQMYVVDLVIENVPEIVEWGPLTAKGRPDKALRGACFRSWVERIKSYGYAVEWRILQCADYGDATTRKRFFLRARKLSQIRRLGPIVWPEPTHCKNPEEPQEDMFQHDLKRWRGVIDCLDMTDLGTSAIHRKKPLCENTMRRIRAGLKKFYPYPFQMDMLGRDKPEDETRLRGLDEPCVTQHAGGNRTAICTPMIVRLNKGCDCTSVHEPIPTLTAGANHYWLATPIVVDYHFDNKAKTALDPLGSVTTIGNHAIVTPIVADMSHPAAEDSSRVRLALEPVSTLTGTRNHAVATPVLEDGIIVDVMFRMLKPKELASAHSFPEGYVLTGTNSDKVKQIGNSVPVETARAICRACIA